VKFIKLDSSGTDTPVFYLLAESVEETHRKLTNLSSNWSYDAKVTGIYYGWILGSFSIVLHDSAYNPVTQNLVIENVKQVLFFYWCLSRKRISTRFYRAESAML